MIILNTIDHENLSVPKDKTKKYRTTIQKVKLRHLKDSCEQLSDFWIL